ncbi:MAG: O-antigen ligase family protein [Actinomycetota bacterium]|nr:O-antigen ligase family protein [Actinomycetota bacterium]
MTFLYLSTFLLLFFYFARSIRAGRTIIYRSNFDIPIVLILVYASITLFLSNAPLIGLIGEYKRYEGLPSIFCYAAIFFLTVQLVRQEKHFEYILKALALGFIPVSLYGLLQAAGLDFPTVLRFESRVHSSLANPVLFGSYLVITLPLLVSLARNCKDEKWRLLSWILVLLGIINLIYTESRGAWLGLVAIIIATILRPTRDHATSTIRRKNVAATGRDKLRTLILAISLFLTFAVVALLFIAPNGDLGQRLKSTFNLSDQSLAIRGEIWKASLKMISDRPLRGYGLEQMGYWFTKYKTAEHTKMAPREIADRAHNDLLQVAIDLGIPGLLFYTWMFIIAFLSLFKGKRARKVPHSTGLFGALIGYFAQSQTGMPAVFITPIIWSLLGSTASIGYPTRQIEVVFPGWLKSKSIKPIPILILIAIIVATIKPIIADVYTFKGIHESRISLEKASSDFEEAIRLDPYQTSYLKTAASFYLDYSSYSQNNIFARRASTIAEQGLKINPRDAELAYYVAEANLLDYNLTENQMALDKAKSYYRVAESLWPDFVVVKRRLLEIAMLQNDLKSAAEKAEELKNLGQVDPNIYYVLALNAERNNEREKAEFYFKKIEQIDPKFLLGTKEN